MRLRRFNSLGVAAFERFLDGLVADADAWSDPPLLDDPALTEQVIPGLEIEPRTFGSRFAAAEYLAGILSRSGIPEPERDRGLWTWLSLLYFDELCPRDARGRLKPGERARWVPETESSRRYYRHLLAGPYRIYMAHRDNPERVRLVLCGPLHSPGDIVEQLASRQEYVTNPSVMEAAAKLYLDPTTRQPRRGAAGKGPGSARRLADILNQLDCTWDLRSFSAQDILDRLPAEFEQFKALAGLHP